MYNQEHNNGKGRIKVLIDKIFEWKQPPQDLMLYPHEVHVWRASLAITEEQQQTLLHLLTPEEQDRANRFHFAHHRRRWIAARSTLRRLLGHYTHSDPHAIAFELNTYGKPFLASPQTTPLLQFNISHSDELALYAFAYERLLGIDIEHMRDNIEYEDLARHSFSPAEQAVLHALPPEQKKRAFFQCWSRKEAYIKARGMGLSLPLHTFDVTLHPEEPARLLASREDPHEVERWSMVALDTGQDNASALVVEQQDTDWQLACWQWSHDMNSNK
jgi:4'-phosphopantetheinyl transferase